MINIRGGREERRNGYKAKDLPFCTSTTIKKQRPRKASLSTIHPLTSKPTFPKPNEPGNPSQVISTICATAGKHAQKSLHNGFFTSAQTFPKANPAERLENPEVPSIMHL